MVQIKTLGIITALKSIGSWMAAYTVSGITADPLQFCYALGIFALINVPSDLFLLNAIVKKNGSSIKP